MEETETERTIEKGEKRDMKKGKEVRRKIKA